jgi:phosphoribosyl 1,2-cyclic phosphodiesterase
VRVVSLASSSSGNALLIEAGPQRRTKLLIDAGLGIRVLTERLRKVGVLLTQLQGVLVTHEHSDHVYGLPALMRRYNTPVITDPRTYAAIEESVNSGVWRTDSGTLRRAAEQKDQALPSPFFANGESEYAYLREASAVFQEKAEAQTQLLDVGARRVIGDIEVISFPTSHDAVAPCGYLLNAGGCRVCVITDSGEVTPVMLDMMRQADLLVLEANHDRERLLRGPYPYVLKKRILSTTGHLSNDQAADSILRTWRSDGVRWLWLAHLSRTNNTPSLALSGIRTRLQTAGANLAQLHISVSPPDMGHIWDSTQLWNTTSLWDMQP